MPTRTLTSFLNSQSIFHKYGKLLSFLLLAGSCVVFANSAIADGFEDTAAKSIEITIRLLPNLKRLELVDQVIVNRAAPKHRDTRLQRGELLVQCENETHDNIGRFSIPDPSVIRSEWLDETGSIESSGSLRGQLIHSQAPVFKIVVPFDDHFTYLRLLKLKKHSLTEVSSAVSFNDSKALKTTISDNQLETVALATIDHSKIAGFGKLRRPKISTWRKLKRHRSLKTTGAIR